MGGGGGDGSPYYTVKEGNYLSQLEMLMVRFKPSCTQLPCLSPGLHAAQATVRKRRAKC